MQIEYISTKREIKKGALRHYDYRFKVLRYLSPLLGLGFLAYGVFLIVKHDELVFSIIGGALIGLGINSILRRPIYAHRTAKRAFKGRPDQIAMEMNADDHGLKISNSFGDSRSNWNTFLDCKSCPDGILLYTHPNIFYWIPISAKVIDADWADFVALITLNIKKSA